MSENTERMRGVAKTQCAGCGEYFSGMGAFDTHRTGATHERRCMTETEMRSAGLDKETCMVTISLDGRFVREQHEVWYDVAKREEISLRKSLGKMPLQASASLSDGG